MLEITEEAATLAQELLTAGVVPEKAAEDALHLAIAVTNGVESLLTWNCKHLANPHLLGRLRAFLAARGLVLPEICTPIELIGQ